MRRHFTFANVVATLALVFAMTGGAWAAKYLVTSTKQISPSVLKKLKGKKGAKGAAGVAGPTGPKGSTGSQGPEGPQGAQGEPGPLVETLPTGETLTGSWATPLFPAAKSSQFVAISYPFPLADEQEATDIVYIKVGEETGTGNCPGTVSEPEAAPGKLCLYTLAEEGTNILGSRTAIAGRGASLFWTSDPASFAVGTWAVTGN